ncbi:MAG: Gfo/Idh/MocA family oxidoreductase [Rhodospirillales bacterium]|nr:Gfo/Idh/MocA family oxidoreductase [Rhodospirillales bacterium]
MRFGLIGYGLWGQHHANAIIKAPGAELAAIACGDDASEAAAKKAFPGITVYRGYQELLARSDIDAVDVVVPNHLHAEVGVAALEAGKDMLLEKPMALSVEECDRLIEAARRNERVLTIGHEFRLSTQWGRVKTLVDEGAIGEPMYALVSLFRHPYRPGSGGWRFDGDKVGSWTLEEPVHFFDSLMWYFEDQGDPVSVLAAGSAKDRQQTGPHNMYDNFTALIRWPGQLYAMVTQTLSGFEHHQVMEIVGSEGAIRTWWSGTMDRTRHPTFELKVLKGGEEKCETLELPPSGELFELEEELVKVVEAFRTRRPIVSGEEARKRIIICLEAERSLKEGKEVQLAF